MQELDSSEFIAILPRLAGIKQKVLPEAICEGFTPGRIFVDRRDKLQTVLVWSAVGYYLLAGDVSEVQDLAEISRVLTDIFIPTSKAMGESGFILIVSDNAWKGQLPTLLPKREVIEIYRRPFTFDGAQFRARGNWREHIPQRYNLQPVDAVLAERLGVLASWASVNDFLANGLGFALVDGNEIASACTSVFASRTYVEIDVHTNDKYQRRGLATITASALIEACLHQGRKPNWECFWDNEPSISLASKLGFVVQPDYLVFFWEE